MSKEILVFSHLAGTTQYILALVIADVIHEILIWQIWVIFILVALRVLDGKRGGEISVLLRPIKPPADLWVIGLVIPRLARDLHLCDVCLLSGVS